MSERVGEMSYTDRDIRALRDKIIEYAKSLTNDWTDFNESDLGMVFLELMVGTADMLNFYLDKQALECFIGTVKQRKNGKGILDLIGYKFKMVNSCTCNIHCKVTEDSLPRLVIPKYTQVLTTTLYNGKAVNYVTKYEYVLEEGVKEFDLPIIQGNLVSASLPVSKFPEDYKIFLGGDKIAEHSVVFQLDEVNWEEVEDVFMDDVDGPKFSMHEDKNDVTYILLHPSYKKYLPVDTTLSAQIFYLDSLGPDGRILKDTVVGLKGIVNGWDLSKVIEANNEEDSSAGADREPLNLAKKRSKNELYTMRTAVILQDYADLAETIPGILKARAIDWSVEDSKYIKVPYVIDIYLVPEYSDYCSEDQIAEVTKFLNERKTSTVKITCKNANYKVVDISMKVYSNVNQEKYADIKTDITNALKYLFDKNNENSFDFGSVIPISILEYTIHNSNKYISYVDILTPEFNVILDTYEYPSLGEVDIEIVNPNNV